MWKQRHAEVTAEKQQYDRMCKLILELQHVRAAAESPEEVTEPAPRVVVDLNAQLLRHYTPCWTPTEDWEDSWLEASHWGMQAMHTAMGWLRDLQWPAVAPLEDEVGLSWAEVALSMIRCHGCWLPVRRTTDSGQRYIHFFASDDQARREGLDLSEQAETAHAIIKQFRSLIPQMTWPDWVSSGRVKSLVLQGFGSWTTGLQCRPCYPHQEAVREDLRVYLPDHPVKLRGLPLVTFDSATAFSLWPEDRPSRNWNTVEKQLTKTLTLVRRRRKTILQQGFTSDLPS
eukprot:Skav234741  [mRNA]  locus=scaffold14:214604:215461:- [translate_table: standard]